jgi:hypothetical protein
MEVTFVRCESFGCKNLTSDLYKKLYGAYCFEHCAKTNKPIGVLDKPKLISPISPRRTKTLEVQTLKSPGVEFENYEFKPASVPSAKFTPVSPKRISPDKEFFVRKTECCICKNPYDETKTMKCGHLICPECLEGRIRTPYCDFCGEPLEGPFVTPEVLAKIEDKYKHDLENGIDNSFQNYEEYDSDEEGYGSDYSDNEEEVIEEHNMTGV